MVSVLVPSGGGKHSGLLRRHEKAPPAARLHVTIIPSVGSLKSILTLKGRAISETFPLGACSPVTWAIPLPAS